MMHSCAGHDERSMIFEVSRFVIRKVSKAFLLTFHVLEEFKLGDNGVSARKKQAFAPRLRHETLWSVLWQGRCLESNLDNECTEWCR